MKLISQNPERYSKVGSSWVISANADSPNKGVTPLSLPIGVQLSNLKPLIKADGIIVKLGDDYLCSLSTLNLIKESNNPHYDIVQNGSVKVKDKEVMIGKTIKIIELNVASLSGIIASRDISNTNAGVTGVVYGPETQLLEGIPQGLIDQINYTLDKVSERPRDEYSIFDFYSLVDYVNNPKAAHYKITPLLVKTQQEDTIFDPTKLREYLIEVGNKLKLLENDFNLIQDIFYEAKLPNNPISYTEKIQASADNDINKSPSVRRNYRDNGEFVDNALATTSNEIKKEIDDLKDQIINEAATQQTSQPVIQKWRLKRKRDGDRNGMGVINQIDKLIFSKGGRKVQPKSIRVIKEGGTFSGYVFKKVVNGKYTLWALQTDANIGVTEYAYQGPGDDVELIP